MAIDYVQPKFVTVIPDKLEPGVLYISKPYNTAIHLCCCGCGSEIVTPLVPTEWKLQEDNAGTVTLSPSIGNWTLPCQSHYFIRRNRIVWAKQMSDAQIVRGRQWDKRAKERYFGKSLPTEEMPITPQTTPEAEPHRSLLEWLRWIIRG